MWRRRPSTTSTLILVSALVLGYLYFQYTLAIPFRFRGVDFGDSIDYITCSRGELWKVFRHSSLRVFGYPFFISLFRHIYPGDYGFLYPLLNSQVIGYFISTCILLLAVAKTGLKMPVLIAALVLIHPGLIAMATIAMTDSLTTSLFNCTLALIISLTYTERGLRSKSAALGCLFGIIISLRPSFLPLSLIAPFVLAVSIMLRIVSSSRAWSEAYKSAALCLLFYVFGIAPLYTHLRTNCYRIHREQCIIPSSAINISETFNYALDFSRWDIIFRPNGVPVAAPTRDRIFPFGSCPISKETPTSSVIECYIQHPSFIAPHFFRRLIGIFDNRHINIYGGGRTPEFLFWMNRFFSVIGFLGVFVAIGLSIRGLMVRRIEAHLLIPLIYLALQLNFHVESRYAFPVTPLFFIVAASVAHTSYRLKGWNRVGMLLAALGLGGSFFYVVSGWDEQYMQFYQFK